MLWAAEDMVMPRDHGQRLPDLLPDGSLATVPDSYTLVSEDNPGFVIEQIRTFLQATSA